MGIPLPLVWVHLGPSKIPKHLEKSLKNHANTFKNYPLVLIVDEEKNTQQHGLEHVKIVKVETQNPEWELIKERLNHDLSFRNGFWFTSIARFRAMAEFMQREKIDRLIHIESDVFLMPNFPMNRFMNMDERLAYCLQGEGQGIAAIFYVGSREILNDFLKFCEDEVKGNPYSTDMTILYRFWNERSNYVVILPTVPVSLESQSNSQEYPGAISENLQFFGGLFDPISIGQYFLGIDPRNTRGRRVIYREDRTHYLKPSKLTFGIDNATLFLYQEDVKHELFSIHIHSKDLRAFNYFSLIKLLKRRLREKNKIETYELSLGVWYKSIGRSILRRIGIEKRFRK